MAFLPQAPQAAQHGENALLLLHALLSAHNRVVKTVQTICALLSAHPQTN